MKTTWLTPETFISHGSMTSVGLPRGFEIVADSSQARVDGHTRSGSFPKSPVVDCASARP